MTQKIAICAPSHNFLSISSQLRHISTIGKKLVKQQYLLHNSSQYGELRPASGSDRFTSLWQCSKSQHSTGFESWLCYCSDVAHQRPTKLCTIFGNLLGWYTIYVNTEFCQVQNSLCVPSLAFSYIGNVTARHLSSGRQPKFAACYMEWNYGTFTDGATYIWLGCHHVGHCPIFWLQVLLVGSHHVSVFFFQ